MIIRRLRGLLATTIGGALVGATAGTVIGLIFLLVAGPKTAAVTPQFPGAVIIVPAALLAVTGALSGAAFGIFLMFAERGRGIDDLRASRVATWAAVTSAATLHFFLSASGLVLGLGTGLAAAIGVGATLLAKRSGNRVTAGQQSTAKLTSTETHARN